VASCPVDPPPPQGFAYWKGPVPPELGRWAQDILKIQGQYPYGAWWTRDYQGSPVGARKDHHTWTRRGGVLITGICIPGITLYRPTVLGEPVINPNVPDPELAMFNEGPGTDWGLVAITGGAIVGLSVLFALGLRHAGRAAR
jgi:hypothetical protein